MEKDISLLYIYFINSNYLDSKKLIIYKEIKNLNKKSQPVSLLADSNNILIKITSKWGFTTKKKGLVYIFFVSHL